IPLASLALALGCQGTAFQSWFHEKPPPPQETPNVAEIDPEVLVRAQTERREYLEREVRRLRADLQQAEDSIVQLESGLRGQHTRADAGSAGAAARRALHTARTGVP